MSGGADSRPVRNTSWLHSEPAWRARRISPVSPVRIVEEAVRDIRDSVRRNLETRYSSDSSPEPELHPNIIIECEFPFDEVNDSLIHNHTDENRLHPGRTHTLSISSAPSRLTNRGEFSLTSYDSSIFDPQEYYTTERNPSQQAMAQQNTPREENNREKQITNDEINAEINHLREITPRNSAPDNQINIEQPTRMETRTAVLDQILEEVRALQDQIS